MGNREEITRRGFIRKSAVAAAGIAAYGQISREKVYAQESKPVYPLLVSAMDGTIRQRAKVEGIETAYKAGLDGLQVQYIPLLDDPNSLRHKKVEIAYREAALQYGIQINALCIGALGRTPLKSEPEGAVWVVEAIKCARNLGSRVILLPILGKGRLESEEEFKRLIKVLKELAPIAGGEGIVLGLECTNSGKDQLRIIQEVNHPAVQIYYDPRNAIAFGYEPLKEIPMLGEYFCEVHIKNGKNYLKDKEVLKKPLRGGRTEGLDHPTIARALKEVNYKHWIVLETSVVSGNPLNDAVENLKYIKDIYNIFD
ncbi:sugar phosphate isomerase/epimerase [bacterium]|nr:sugar phosphate isomerase/epimerase [bacterium]